MSGLSKENQEWLESKSWGERGKGHDEDCLMIKADVKAKLIELESKLTQAQETIEQLNWSVERESECRQRYETQLIAISKSLNKKEKELKQLSNQWISVDDGLPYEYSDVWVSNGISVDDCHYNPATKSFYDEFGSDCSDVTHWMVRQDPEPPKEG